ncbi:MAG: hypothetical protein KDB00_23960 [Planctomycetales bacterium]|nr:hypothetical protein [Planctomycetales bacterium]
MKWKHLLRYPFDIRLAEEQLASSAKLNVSKPNSVKSCATIGLDLYTDKMLFDCARHLACLSAFAAQIDSPVVLRCSRVLLAAIAHKSLGKEFLAMPHVRWIEPGHHFPKNSLVLLDIDGERADRPLYDQRTVAMLIGRDPVAKTMVMPYPMHPNQIAQFDAVQVASFRRQFKAGVFFAGSQHRRYGREAMHEKFGVLSRLEMLDVLRRQFGDRIARRDAGGNDRKIVLRDSAKEPIAAADWMSILSSHQFFLCCPGASQPVCHNVIEAMSLGVVPIIEYGDRFDPELIDGYNSICFEGRKGLAAAIRRIDTMPPEKRNRLSRNVCQYYDDHLDGAAFLKRLRDELNTDFVDQISMPFHDQNLYSTGSPPSGRVPASRRKALDRNAA